MEIQKTNPEVNKSEIVAVKKQNGHITKVKFDNGDVKSLAEVKDMVESGNLDGYVVGSSKTGQMYIRSLPDQHVLNNLSRLPKF